MRKRVLSLLLAICLVIGLLPPTALAAEGAAESLFKVTWGDISWDVAANSVYYATTGTGSSITNHGTTNPGDDKWNVKLDTTGSVPQLTLRNASYYKTLTIGEEAKPVLTDLNIVIEGNNAIALNRNCFVLYVTGTTTFSSTTNGTLTTNANSATQYSGIQNKSDGDLYFKDVDIITSTKANRAADGGAYGISAKGDIVIDGGSVTFTAKGNIANGIKSSAGSITVRRSASVIANTDGSYTPPTGADTRRHVLSAKTGIFINSASVEVIDTNTVSDNYHVGNFDDAFNVIPTITNAKVYYKESIDGVKTESVEGVTADIMAKPYLSIEKFCPGHEYDNGADIDCNICGEPREVPKDITVTFVGGVTWNATAGQTYYATTSAAGAVTDLGTTAPADGKWNIMLDNTSIDGAVLTLKGAKVETTSTSNAIVASGEGKLKIVVAEASSVKNKGITMKLDMAGGTTITSLNKSLLSVTSTATDLTSKPFDVTRGSICFETANIFTSNSPNNGSSARGAITTSVGEVIIDKSTIVHNGAQKSAIFINSASSVTIRNFSKITATNTAGDPTSQTSSVYARFTAIQAGTGASITIDSSTVELIDQAGCWRRMFSVTPTINGATTKYSPDDYQGNTLQDLTDTAVLTTVGACKYVKIEAICNPHVYDSNNPYDFDCNNCGYIDTTKPREIAVTFGNYVDKVIDQQIIWKINPGEVYYAVTNDQGVISSWGMWDPTTPEPEGWNIKLDNREATAVLTLCNANIKKLTEKGFSYDNNAITVVGEGKLKIVIKGKSTIETGKKSCIVTSMNGGTTYISDSDSLLTLKQAGTSGANCISETAGSLTFENVNINATDNRQNKWAYAIIEATSGDLSISGGKLLLMATDYGVKGLVAGGNLTIDKFAKVTVVHANPGKAGTPGWVRYGVEAGGAITINDASLRIQNTSGQWDYAINKLPNTNNNVKAEYSEKADGTDLKTLPLDAVTPIEYPYVSFVYNCENIDDNKHNYTDNVDPECNDCGFIRDVPRDVTIRVVTDGGDTKKTLADIRKEVTIKAKDVHYFVADENGLVTSITTTKPENWDFMLDNTDIVAKLVFADKAKLTKSGTYSEKVDGNTVIYNLLTVSGEGALEIVIDGNATLTSGYGHVIETRMAGGTTYISENVNNKLTLNQNGTSGFNTIRESKGALTFKNVNIHATSKRQGAASNMLHGAGDVNIKGGKLYLNALNCSTNGLYATGNLTITDFAQVTLLHSSFSNNPTVKDRYAVNAGGTITIDNASLRIQDKTGMWDYAINKMPSLKNVKAEYSVNSDGTGLQSLPQDVVAPIEYAYVSFVFDCKTMNGDHKYDGEHDADCNYCGFVRDIPRDVTIRVVTNGGDKNKQLDENSKAKTIKAKEVYYFVADDKGLVTSITTTKPENWDFMLDNSNPVAELVFNEGAYLNKAGDLKEKVNDKDSILNLLTVSGEGKLKVIIKGATTLTSSYGNVIYTAMAGGTTYTSENNSKLTLNQTGTSGQTTISETAGDLNFVNANIRATNNRSHATGATTIIKGSYDVNVIGGSIEIEALNCATQGLTAGGNLKLTDWAKVKLIAKTSASKRYKVGTAAVRHAVEVSGEFTIDNASLCISDAIDSWDAAVNKSPKLIGGTAKYSESADGSNLQALNPADPAAAVEYPFVAYIIDCAEHIYDNAADPDCNRCGDIRPVPYDIQVVFQYGTAELLSIGWDVKVGEVYYATTNATGQITDLGKKDSEPANWNIKLDNTGTEAVLTLKEATIIRKVRPKTAYEPFNIGVGGLGTITAQGKGALRIVCEKASTITSGQAYGSIITSMDGGTTYSSKNNAKLTLTTSSTATTGGIKETIGDLTFENANVSVMIKKTSKKNTSTTVTANNLTVIGGKVEVIGAGYANNALYVKGDLLVKDNGILIVTTGSGPSSGDCATKPYGMKVDGELTVENATLMVKKYGGSWSYLINKMPTMVGAEAYMSEKSTKESKLEAFSKDAGADMTEMMAKFFYFSNAKPGTLDDGAADEEEEEEDDDLIFDDPDNPFTGDTVNLTLLFVLVMTSAAALIVLFSKKKVFRE